MAPVLNARHPGATAGWSYLYQATCIRARSRSSASLSVTETPFDALAEILWIVLLCALDRVPDVLIVVVVHSKFSLVVSGDDLFPLQPVLDCERERSDVSCGVFEPAHVVALLDQSSIDLCDIVV